MIKENLAWTQPWHCRRQVLRSAALLPECGLEKDTFVVSLPEYCQVTARKMIQKGTLPMRHGRVMLPSPLLVQDLETKEEHVIDFLGGLYSTLTLVIDEFQKHELSLEDKLIEIRRMRKELQDNGPEDHIIMRLTDEFLNQFCLPRIGSLDFAKEDINRIYNGISITHYQQFGDARMNAIREFYHSQGESICEIFKKAMNTVSLSANVQENILEVLIEYFNLNEMLVEPLEPALQLLALYEKRNANSWEFAWIHQVISDAYLGCFSIREDWLERSNEHLELSCEYSRRAYEDNEKENLEVQS